MKHKDLPRWFKSKPSPMKLTSEQIDRENGILHGVILAQVGEAKGHDVHLEQEFIDTIVSYANEHYSEIGLKARFGHPSMSDTTMGKQLGKFLNFRTDGNKAVADLHVLKAANNSPTHPKMADWVFDMAENDADFIMNSIVFAGDGYYQYNAEGEKVEGYDIEGEKVYIKLGDLHYSDLVEAGAATDNLFSNQFNQDKFAVQAIDFVKEHPALHSFLKDNPHKLVEFATQVGIQLPKRSFKDKFQDFKDFLFKDENPSEDVHPIGSDGDDDHDDIFLLKEKHASDLDIQKIELTEQHENEMEALQKVHLSEIDELKKQLQAAQEQIAELKEIVPDEHTDFEEEPPAPVEAFKVTSRATQKAMELYKRKQERKQKK